MKKYLLPIAVLMMAVLLLAGCGDNNSGVGG